MTQMFPTFRTPFHIVVPTDSRSRVPGIVSHVSGFPYQSDAFVRINDSLYVSSPELCFVQLAQVLPFHETVKAGCALCSSFALDPMSQFGLASRKPLTSRIAIQRFIERNPGHRGNKKARRLLPYLVEGTASPAEIRLAMMLTLPLSKGGFGLKGLVANKPIKLGKKTARSAGRSTVIPDLLDEEHRIAIEYDADQTHGTGHQLTRDATKRMALETMGIRVLTVTSGQLRSPAQLGSVAKEIGRLTGQRIRPRGKQYATNLWRLHRMPVSFDRLFCGSRIVAGAAFPHQGQ